jgi:hypothetical protein
MVKYIIKQHDDLLNIISGNSRTLLINSDFSREYCGKVERAAAPASIEQNKRYNAIIAGGLFSCIYDLFGCFVKIGEHLENNGVLAVKDFIVGADSAYFNALFNIIHPSFVRGYRPEEAIEAAKETFHLKRFAIESENKRYKIPKDPQTESVLLKALAGTPEHIVKGRQIVFSENTLSLSVDYGIFAWEKE